MTLTRARVIFATGGFGHVVTDAIRSVLAEVVDPAHVAAEVVAMRKKLEASRSRLDLKRGPGGLTDLEFLVQYLLMVHAPGQPDLLKPNFWDALFALRRRGIITAALHDELRDAYDFLRTVEARLRLIHNRSVSEIPESSADLERLARRLGDEQGDPGHDASAFLANAARVMYRTRELFEQILLPAGATIRHAETREHH
jgi:glutamate-ammonia-ligase adenylyltransferase